MSEAFRSFLRFLEEGGYAVTIPLLVLAVTIWAMVLERIVFLGGPFLERLSPGGRHRRAVAGAAIEEAFSAYLAAPRRETREALLSTCRAPGTPLTRFVWRALRGRPTPSRQVQDVLLDRALVLGLAEIRHSFRALHSLGWAAILAGILAAVGGLQGSLQAMAESGMTSDVAWASGASSALRGSELAAIVAMPAVLGLVWLSYRAAGTSREMRRKRSLLGEAFQEPWEVDR
jgi:MotA/TolQ/ExbB proton channel family protein